MWKNIIWEDTKQDKSILSFEHPLYPIIIYKKHFEEEFNSVLELLNGETMSDYIDFYFEKDAINLSCLRFIDENAKADFYDWAVELGCLMSLKEIYEGESEQSKQERRQLEQLEQKKIVNNKQAQEIQRQKINERLVKHPPHHKDKLRLLSRKKVIDKMKQNPKKAAKLEKALMYFETEYNNYKKTYQIIIEEFENIL